MYLAGPTAVTFLAKSKVVKKNNTFISRLWLQIFFWNVHPYIWGLQQIDMMSEFTLFTTICHWTCPTLEDDFVSVVCFFLRFSEENCKIMSAAHHVGQHATPISFFQHTQGGFDLIWANNTTTSSTAGSECLVFVSFFVVQKHALYFFFIFFSNMPKYRG